MITDLDWVLAERERHRVKAQRNRLRKRQAVTCIATQRLAQIKERAANPEKYSAHIKTGNAIRDGKLMRQPCEVCGKAKAQAHHDDYSKPLEVRWLCVKHHNEHHRKEREAIIIQQFHDRQNQSKKATVQ